MKPLFVKAGDTFFTHSNSWLGRLIRWGERDKGEPAPWANHMGVIVASGWIGPDPLPGEEAVIVEALWKTRMGTWESFTEGTEIRVFRINPPYRPDELDLFLAKARSYVGDTYGWWKLFGFLGKKVTGIDIPRYFFIDKRPICSYLAGEVNAAARPWPVFGCPAQETDPDNALQFCERYPELWIEVT